MPITYLTRCTFIDNLTLASLTSRESNILPLAHVDTLESLVLRVSSVSGTADAKLEYATSPDGTNFNAYADNTSLTNSTATSFPNNAEGFNVMFPPTNAPMNGYIKFRLTGVNANPADTLATLYGFLREGIR